MKRLARTQAAGWVVGCAISGLITATLIGRVVQQVSGNRMAPWIIGRAAGVTSYLLLVTLVLTGLVLSHPWRSRVQRPGAMTRIRLHAALAALTFAFTAVHVLVLATDRYAGVGWRGMLVPLGASYRPVATTVGLIGLWSGLLAGITAAAAGHLPLRLWWPIHKLASVSLLAVWLHGVFGGSDSAALRWLYLGTAALFLCLAYSRYVVRSPRDTLAERSRS